MMFTTRIATPDRPAIDLTDDMSVRLGQIIDVDGEGAVVLDRADIRNGSGRIIGERLTITEQAWDETTEGLI